MQKWNVKEKKFLFNSATLIPLNNNNYDENEINRITVQPSSIEVVFYSKLEECNFLNFQMHTVFFMT